MFIYLDWEIIPDQDLSTTAKNHPYKPNFQPYLVLFDLRILLLFFMLFHWKKRLFFCRLWFMTERTRAKSSGYGFGWKGRGTVSGYRAFKTTFYFELAQKYCYTVILQRVKPTTDLFNLQSITLCLIPNPEVRLTCKLLSVCKWTH